MSPSLEINKIEERYARRLNIQGRYSLFNFSSLLAEQERERYLIKCLRFANMLPVEDKKVLEIGAGMGGNVLFLLKLGFKTENILVNELLPERIEILKSRLPNKILLLEGDASELSIEPESVDIVFQSMVFTSILQSEFKKTLANKIWSWVKPGGGVIWYDFTYNNPNNPDVKGVKFKEITGLFENSEIQKWRLTLAPPLSRAIKGYPPVYSFLNLFPFFRTHLLCWIRKK